MVKNKNFNLEMQISTNKVYSTVKATIKKESVLQYSKNLPDIILKEINKKKLRSGILINLFDKKLKAGIKDLVTKIRINDHLTEDFTLELCKWPEPILTRNDGFIHHHKEKREKEIEEEYKGMVNYADRGFITTAEEGDLVLEYLKPKLGKAGRNFKGIYIPAKEPSDNNKPKFVVDVQTIEVNDDSERTLYIAKAKGYVKHDETELRIADNLEIEGANFKETGNINAGHDKDVKIVLKGKEKHEDNIGPNTKIAASQITVGGSVANGAELSAEKVIVQGQTHKTSKIYAGSANINLHKGYLEAKEVVVEKLENGEIVADDIKVTQAIGGILRGKRIEIAYLFSNVSITASKEIRITKSIKGSDNVFIIEPASSKDEREKLEKLLKESKVLEKQVKDMQKDFLSKNAGLKHAQESSVGLKEIIMKAKRDGRKPSQIHIDRYKQTTEFIQEVKELQEDLQDIENKFSVEKHELSLIQDAALHARIINEDNWNTHNKVFYKLIQPEMKIEYIPKVGMKASELMLKMVGEDDYEVEVKYL